MPIREILRMKSEFLSKQVNALASKVKIHAKRAYQRGEKAGVDIELILKAPLEARSLQAKLTCTEIKKTKTVREMDTYDRRQEKDLGIPYSTHLQTSTSISEKEIHSERIVLGKHKKYESGIFHAEFDLPASLPPTNHAYGHENRKVIW
ncbi:MAG: hypothetical protein QW275_01995, partial [Candidatus Anstonellaceae archaeon]